MNGYSQLLRDDVSGTACSYNLVVGFVYKRRATRALLCTHDMRARQLSAARVIAHRGYYVTAIKNCVLRARKCGVGGRAAGRSHAPRRSPVARRTPTRSHAASSRPPRWVSTERVRPRTPRLDPMEYQHQPIQPLGPPAPPPQLLPPAPPPPLPSLPQLQHGHAQDDDRWNQYHIWRQHVFVNGQWLSSPILVVTRHQEACAHFLRRHSLRFVIDAAPSPERRRPWESREKRESARAPISAELFGRLRVLCFGNGAFHPPSPPRLLGSRSALLFSVAGHRQLIMRDNTRR